MDTYWLKVILMLLLFWVALHYSNKGLRKWLQVDKKKMFSYHHVNATHRTIDGIIRICVMLLLIISLFINIERNPQEPLWYLQTHIILFAYIVVSETVTVIMEKRYAVNKNDYLFTLFELVIIVIFSLLLYFTNFFGLI
ncbi:DUF4181 domain-containing protein [Pseudalkalibacillus hwajinpoensis]|uniref:DUF4181 domain-containing protein n=1 Tax=Guptibacillus hwajinpoensis TaxID=208199 RepID=UPI001CFEE34C|nr:DUF4181 domain-containing protein [Pseudalkalibacillus hwajinpoensis]